MSAPLDAVRDHVRGHFSQAGIDAEPDTASVTFLGVERMDVMRFGPDPDGVARYVSLGCSRHPMTDPASIAADPLRGPRAEIVMTLRGSATTPGLARSLAVIAATPAVEGVVLVPDALVDLSAPLWEAAAFTAVLLGGSDIPDMTLRRRGRRSGSCRPCRSPRPRRRGCDSRVPKRCGRPGSTTASTCRIRIGGPRGPSSQSQLLRRKVK